MPLTGIIVPLCTPLTAEGTVDHASLERLVEFQLGAGVDAVFALGTSGEGVTLPPDQRGALLRTVVGTVAGQVPVVAGAIDSGTDQMIRLAREAAAAGATHAAATCPFYVRIGPPEQELHFRQLHAAVDLPLLAYDAPKGIHHRLDPEVVARLAADGVITGLKDSSDDLLSMRRLRARTADHPAFTVLSGAELMVDAALLLGLDGAVPGLANVDPHGYVELRRAVREGRTADATAVQQRLIDLFEIVRLAGGGGVGATAAGLGGFKTALVARGIIAGNTLTRPLPSPGGDAAAAIAAVLDRHGLR